MPLTPGFRGASRRVRDYLRTFSGFEPEARLFLLACFLVGTAASLYWIDFNLYLESLGLTNSTIGLIATVSAITGVIVAFPAGILSDRLGRRAVLTGGAALMTLAFGGFIVTSSPLVIGGLVAVFSAGAQAFWVVQVPFLTERSRPEHRNELFAVAFAMENGTNVVAAIAGGVLAQALAAAGLGGGGPEVFRVLLFATMAIMAVALLSLFRLPIDRPYERPAGTPEWSPAPEPGPGTGSAADGHGPARTLSAGTLANEDAGPGPRRRRSGLVVGDRRLFARLLLPGFIISLGAGQLIPFLNLFIEHKFGLDVAALNAVFAVTSFGTVTAILLQPAIARRFGKVASVVLVQSASIPFLVVLGFSPILWTVILSLAVRNSLMNAGSPVANAFAMEQVRPEERATMSAAMEVLWSLGWAIAGPWYAFTQAVLGFDAGYMLAFVTIIVLYVGATALYWFWFHDTERRGVAEPAAA